MSSEAITQNDLKNILDSVLPPDRSQDNDLGAYIDISGYTSSSMYICASDGYVFVYNGSNTAYAVIVGATDSTNAIACGVSSGRDSVYVRKGMRLYTVGSPSAVRFFPFV